MTLSNIHPADVLLELKAQMAELEILAKAEHARLVAMGLGAHEGEFARATVTNVKKTKVDWQAIAEELKPSLRYPRDTWSDQLRDIVDDNTNAIPPYPMVRVVARIGKAA
jgi:hypothetical protein